MSSFLKVILGKKVAFRKVPAFGAFNEASDEDKFDVTAFRSFQSYLAQEDLMDQIQTAKDRKDYDKVISLSSENRH
jgi:hypothetical protein